MSEVVALLDLGSNAARFLLARLDPDPGFRILEHERIPTRLAGPGGLLCEVAVQATARAAEQFLRRVRKRQPRVLAVATAAVRDAPNRECLITMLRQRGGVELCILSGREEARLGAEAALRELPLWDGCVVDLGGGSLQLTPVRAGRLGAGTSVPLGAARMTRQYLEHDPARTRELLALRVAAAEVIASELPGGSGHGRMLALGGTARALARRRLRIGDDRPKKHRAATLRLSELKRMRARFERLTTEQRTQLRGMKPERADIVVAGAIVLEELMQHAGYAAFTVCSASVREGVLWREARRLSR